MCSHLGALILFITYHKSLIKMHHLSPQIYHLKFHSKKIKESKTGRGMGNFDKLYLCILLKQNKD